MATVEKSNLKTEAYFSDDKKHRFLLRKQWDSKKPTAMVLMINPSNAEEIVVEHSTMFTINNLSKLGYGNVDILNMFSKVGTKLRMGIPIEELTTAENDDFIQKSAEKADIIVIAWGKGAENSKRVAERQTHLIQLLSSSRISYIKSVNLATIHLFHRLETSGILLSLMRRYSCKKKGKCSFLANLY